MRAARTCLLIAAMAAVPSQAADPPGTGIVLEGVQTVDLTHPLNEWTIFWPTAERFRLEKVADGPTEQGYHYAANNFHSAEHGGTHLDAPVHFAAGGATTDRVPLDRLMGAAAVVDVTVECARDRDYLVRVADFERWEQAHGKLGPETLVLIRTGYAARWPDAATYLGTAERGPAAVPKLHFPGLDPAAARWLVEQRRIKAVGIDTASIDRGQSTSFEAHCVLAAHGVPVFENVAALDKLPARGATVIALPAKIEGGSGGPLRVIALLPSRRP